MFGHYSFVFGFIFGRCQVHKLVCNAIADLRSARLCCSSFINRCMWIGIWMRLRYMLFCSFPLLRLAFMFLLSAYVLIAHFRRCFPALIFSSLSQLQCWNSCSSSSAPTTSPWSPADAIGLNVRSLIRDGSLITADIAWHLEHEPSQCLVTWEVFGGGIKGNLLTDTSDVQISLWSDSKYHVEVTCKDKVNFPHSPV